MRCTLHELIDIHSLFFSSEIYSLWVSTYLITIFGSEMYSPWINRYSLTIFLCKFCYTEITWSLSLWPLYLCLLVNFVILWSHGLSLCDLSIRVCLRIPLYSDHIVSLFVTFKSVSVCEFLYTMITCSFTLQRSRLYLWLVF